MRGTGRSSAKVRSKSSASPLKSPPRPAKGGAADAHPPATTLSPRAIFAISGLALAGVIVIALATDHRGARLVHAAADALAQASAVAGLRLQSVRLEGATPDAAQDILRAAGLQKGAPLLTLDLDGVRQRVDQVGWVKSARVVRLFPDSVAILVDERHLVAVWEHGGQTHVVDTDGVIAPEADPGRFADLPLVVGEGANAAAAAILPLIQSRQRLAERIEALVRVDDRRWDLRLKDNTLVQLPATDEEAALLRLDQLDQSSRILDLNFARIDLRDPEMVAVRPREKPAVGSETNGVG